MIEPVGVLARVAARVRLGGLLVIETPDFGSTRARNLRGRWKHMKPDEHLSYFSERSLERLVAECGSFVRCERVVERDRMTIDGTTHRVPARDKLHVIWKRIDESDERMLETLREGLA